MEITLPQDVIERIETVLKEQGQEPTPELMADVTSRLLGYWSANLYDDVCSSLDDIEEDAETDKLIHESDYNEE